MTHSLTRLLLILVSLLSLTLMGCSEKSSSPGPQVGSTAPAPEAPAKPDSTGHADNSEQRLRERANAYLEALRINDLASAYRMEAGYLDGSLTPLVFRDTAIPLSGSLLSYSISSVSLQGDEGQVEAEVSFQLPQMRKPYETKMAMHWVTRNGDFFHKLQKASDVQPQGNPLPPSKTGMTKGPTGVPPLKIH